MFVNKTENKLLVPNGPIILPYLLTKYMVLIKLIISLNVCYIDLTLQRSEN